MVFASENDVHDFCVLATYLNLCVISASENDVRDFCVLATYLNLEFYQALRAILSGSLGYHTSHCWAAAKQNRYPKQTKRSFAECAFWEIRTYGYH